jgi:putative phosphoesterase
VTRPMRFLCLSDIHGHYRALEATLSYAEVLGFDQLVVCGDLCFPGPEPLKVWKTLTELRALCVQGVSDRALACLDPDRLTATTEAERVRVERLRAVHLELGDLILARLGKLPAVAHLPVESGDTLVVVHGSPLDPTEPLTHDMTDQEIDVLLADDPADIVVCGGSHVPFERMVGEVRVVNVGSVGEAPGCEVAHATLLETSPLGVHVHQFDVPLDR